MAYGNVTELARILTLTSPTAAQTAALQRCLDAAAWEIDAYLDRTTPLTDTELPVVTEVNYERAAEHWKQEQSRRAGEEVYSFDHAEDRLAIGVLQDVPREEIVLALVGKLQPYLGHPLDHVLVLHQLQCPYSDCS